MASWFLASSVCAIPERLSVRSWRSSSCVDGASVVMVVVVPFVCVVLVVIEVRTFLIKGVLRPVPRRRGDRG
jgi:hypothetical protein